ncbi:MAG: hypothetical protein V1754_03850 [Pseudomonadota bacterium]
MAKDPMIQIAVRVPKALVEDLDEIAERMKQETGMEVTRANVVRASLTRYIAEEGAKTKPRARIRMGDTW